MINQFHLAMNQHQNNIGYPKLGYVTDSNPQNSTVKVKLAPDNVETGWMPFSVPFIGWCAPPKAGDQALVLYQEGSKANPIGCMLLYSNAVLPPSDVAIGEVMLMHSTGSFIKLSNDGKVTLNGHTEIDITAPTVIINTTGNAEIKSTGDVTVTGQNIALSGNSISMGATGGSPNSLVTYQGLKSYVDNHKHDGVQSGQDVSGVPSEAMPESTATTVVKAQ